MIGIKITFKDGYKLITTSNRKTIEEARDYYINAKFNIGDMEDKDKIISVEELWKI